MDENTYSIIKEVHEHLSSVSDFSTDQAKLIMAGEIAKLRTVLMFYGGITQPIESNEGFFKKTAKSIIGG